VSLKKVPLVERVIKACKKERRCSRYELILWFGMGISTSYGLWSLLKTICMKGLLDDDELRCVYDDSEDVIVFEEVRKA